jgi:hypothetical protein
VNMLKTETDKDILSAIEQSMAVIRSGNPFKSRVRDLQLVDWKGLRLYDPR